MLHEINIIERSLMSREFNIYCDESCHLENDKQKAMVLGLIWCDKTKRKEIGKRINEIKEKYDLPKTFEIKWTKISPSKIDFYMDLVDYFFDDDDLHFRGLVIPDKSKLQHEKFNNSHDDFYYKMYFLLIKAVIAPQNFYDIYLDIKDTRSANKTDKLHEVLSNTIYDFNQEIIKKIQLIHSDESAILQLTDLLIGALSYAHRDLQTSQAKLQIIERIKKRSHYSLLKSTLLKEDKFNIFVWNGSSNGF